MTLDELNKIIQALQPGETLRLEAFDENTYHNSIGIGSTSLKKYIDCPAKFKYGKPFESKSYLDVGSASHYRVLTPELFDANFRKMPESIKQKRGKEWDKFEEANEGKTILKPSDWDESIAISDSVMRSHSKFFTGGTPEVSYWKRHEIYTNLILKARLDYEHADLAIDLKTSANAKPEKFSKTAVDIGYHIQDCLYRYVTEKPEFVFIAVEKEQPYCVAGPLMFDELARRFAALLCEKAYGELSESFDMDYWPGYKAGSITMSLAPWHVKQLNALEEETYL